MKNIIDLGSKLQTYTVESLTHEIVLVINRSNKIVYFLLS